MLHKIASFTLAIIASAMLIAVSVSVSAQTESTIYNFQGMPDGSVPSAGLARDSAGNLYGTTTYGGSSGYGTVFKINSKGVLTTLHNFSGKDGANPASELIRDAAGNLYGTTQYGGNGAGGGIGTVFEINSGGKETVLYSFKGTADGGIPLTSLVRDSSGNLYGTTSLGGDTSCRSILYSVATGCGTIFKLSSSRTFKVLHTFASGTDCRSPFGNLIGDTAGNLYGTTYDGGTHSYGCVFKSSKAGAFTILYSFNFGEGADGARPIGGVVRDKSGNLYGTTRFGGYFGNSTCQGSGCGTIFKLDSSATESVLYTFTGDPDGSDPNAGLAIDSAGNLYGTTSKGGTNDGGTIFSLPTNGSEIVLHSFNGNDGSSPAANPTLGVNGDLFGTASGGGTGGAGVVFKFVP